MRILAGERLVAGHPLVTAPGQLVTTPDHLVAVRALTRRAKLPRATEMPPGAERETVPRRPEVEVRPLAASDLALGMGGGCLDALTYARVPDHLGTLKLDRLAAVLDRRPPGGGAAKDAQPALPSLDRLLDRLRELPHDR